MPPVAPTIRTPSKRNHDSAAAKKTLREKHGL
jgi:hypothetical protein